VLRQRGLALGICCHPYDLCTELVAREAGVHVCDASGQPVRARLAVEPDVAWVGYANTKIRAQIEPLLKAALRQRELLAENDI
ncbi:MAG: inositol monophosphatase, partial [Blastocatellia bacterium]